MTLNNECPRYDETDMDSMEIEVTESDGIATTSLSCASFASSSSSSSLQSKQAAEARQS
jgi:hypothetical protein